MSNGKPISVKQAAALISTLMTNAPWDEMSRDDAQIIIDSAHRVEPHFLRFIKETAAQLRAGSARSGGHVTQAPAVNSRDRILQFDGTVVVSATTAKFVAKEKFVVNTEGDALVKISYLGDNFKAWFLSGDGKTEDSISEQTLRHAKLCEASVDGPIIAELGGRELAETTLSEMFALMEKQGKGEDGCLLSNGYANIFYIKDQNGVLRAVDVLWLGSGWFVNARSVEFLLGWLVGFRVFSRNSVLEPSEPSV